MELIYLSDIVKNNWFIKLRLFACKQFYLLYTFANTSNATCGTSVTPNVNDKGNYLCLDCTGALIEEVMFIKSTVNPNVDRWRPNQTVTITNGKTYTTLTYAANGNFVPTRAGNGVGPGKAINHNGNGKSCSKDDNSGSSGGNPNASTGATPPPIDLGAGGGGFFMPIPPSRRGTVTIEECQWMPGDVSDWCY